MQFADRMYRSLHERNPANDDRLYHTFDGIDGKKAMKNRDSEIEELYDHGADAITGVLQALLLAAALQFPAWAPDQAFCLLTLSLLAIFSTHFTAHVTHTFVFADFDAAEAQCILAGALALTGYFGQGFWHQPIALSTPLATLVSSASSMFTWYTTEFQQLLSLSAILLTSKILDGFMTVVWARETPLEAAGIAIPRRHPDYTSCIQIGLIVISGGMACYAGAIQHVPVLFVLHYRVGYAKISIQTVILSKVRASPALMDNSIAFATISGTVYGWLLHSGMERAATLVLIVVTILSLEDFFRLATFATWDFQSARRTKAFAIRPEEELSARVRNEGFYVTASNLDEIKEQWIKFKKEQPDLLKKMYC